MVVAGTRISNRTALTVVGKLPDYPFPKVIDAYPGTDGEGMIALGLANGKVILATFGTTVISKEFGRIILFQLLQEITCLILLRGYQKRDIFSF